MSGWTKRPRGAGAPLSINLDGIPADRWTEREELCADCRCDVGGIGEFDYRERAMPLLLWREGTHREMLRLCWPCARKRMKANTE